MNKLEIKADKVYEWSSEKIKCPDKKLAGNKYIFYNSLKIDGIEYVTGSGVLIKSDDKLYFGCVHYFYDINFAVKNRYRVAVELFHKPNEIQYKLDEGGANYEFDVDYEVIKKETLVLSHFNVISIVKRCLLVYGLKEEQPLELIQEFSTQTQDPIYICRFILYFIDNKYILRDAVNDNENEIKTSECQTVGPKNSARQTVDRRSSDRKTNDSVVMISDSEDDNNTPISRKYKNFTVRTSIQKDSKILLKIKREPTTPTSRAKTPSKKKQQASPSTLLQKLHISKSPDISKHSENSENAEISLDKNFQQLLLNSPSKQNKEMEPVVLLDRINTENIQNTPNTQSNINIRKSSRISTRRSSAQNIVEQLPITRSRRTARKSYAQYYVVDDLKDLKECDDENVVLPQTPRRNKRTSVVKMETTPTKIQKTQTPKTQKNSKAWFNKMTPSIQERGSPMVFGNTPMSRARLGLSAHNVPMKTPCREAEYLSIYNFVSVRIKDQTSGCMYISGVPGTGKTMTVCKVMNDMSEQKEDYGDFVFLKLNALALTEPRQIYVQIIKKLLNKKLHWEEALKEMNRFFKAKKKKISHVILIDELDKLCNRKQDVVYNLLDLPFNSVTPLIVITIANTMDLPERILSNKVNSRLGLVRQTFKPYQYKDLVKIVTERLAADAVFKNEALELVARKVAAVSGDARRALTMCSRATEIAEEENKDLVTMDIVDRVIKEMSSSSKVQAIQCCSKLEQFILESIANEVTRTGNEEVPFLNMLYNLEKLCVLESFKLPSIELILKSCHNLGSFRLLITQHGRMDLHMTLMLNISTDDIHYALRNN